jgi:hypothetical protein
MLSDEPFSPSAFALSSSSSSTASSSSPNNLLEFISWCRPSSLEPLKAGEREEATPSRHHAITPSRQLTRRDSSWPRLYSVSVHSGSLGSCKPEKTWAPPSAHSRSILFDPAFCQNMIYGQRYQQSKRLAHLDDRSCLAEVPCGARLDERDAGGLT